MSRSTWRRATTTISTRAVKTRALAKGKNATLAPLVRRIAHWREHGLRVFLTARAQTQAERLVDAPPAPGSRVHGAPRGVRSGMARARPSDEVAGRRWCRSRAASVLPADGLVLVTEEEIFGARAHRRRERARSRDARRPFLEDLREPRAGDYVVHVEHGIGRYQGLVHKDVVGPHGRSPRVEYAGGDKLYLPV